MLIGVVADTHSLPVPQQMLDDFKNVDLIIHAGDICEIKDLEIFKKIKNTQAVYGNMDSPVVRQTLPGKIIFNAGTVAIGVFHGEGPAAQVPKRVQKEFERDAVNVVVFGHSHHAFNDRIGKVLYFNPGSPSDKVCAPYRSYGILEINGSQVTGKIIKIKD